jgi:flavin reductase (DIM6/NTAB) family NADH-FMN oxidoreductase RutF
MKKSIGAQATPFPAPVWVVGTYDAEGRPNMMTAAWAGICCSKPPCVAVSLRRVRYTYENIVSRRAFTINVPSAEHVKAVDYWGIVSGKDEDKVARTGLTPVRSLLVDAPYIDEFPVVLECQVRHTLEIGSHTQFVGEILDIKVEKSLFAPDGRPDPEKLALFVFLDDYFRVGGYLAEAFSAGKEL